eukprot:529846_1
MWLVFEWMNCIQVMAMGLLMVNNISSLRMDAVFFAYPEEIMENLGSTKTIEVTSPIDDDTDEKEDASDLNLNVGDRILTAEGMGVIRFIGEVQFDYFDERERI